MNESMFKDIKWGDIFICNLGDSKGSVQKGLRPVIVVQTNNLNSNSPTVTVAVITTSLKRKDIKTHILLDNSCGLQKPSMVVLEQIRTIDKIEELVEYVGCVTNENTILKIKDGLRYQFSLVKKPKVQRKGLIMSLCFKCQQEYFKNPSIMLRRLDHFQSEKELCENCQDAYGYDYMIILRQHLSKHKHGGDLGV